jgi:hypothetical protein
VSSRAGRDGALPLEATWATTPEGYRVHCVLPIAALGLARDRRFLLDVLVNDMGRGRERRRGQLVMSGAAGEFVYLRGDRQPLERLLTFAITDA